MKSAWHGRAYPLVVIDKAGPVEHVHHGLEAEDGRLVELAVVRHSEGLGCQLEGLVPLCPGKFLLPGLPNKNRTYVRGVLCINTAGCIL